MMLLQPRADLRAAIYVVCACPITFFVTNTYCDSCTQALLGRNLRGANDVGNGVHSGADVTSLRFGAVVLLQMVGWFAR